MANVATAVRPERAESSDERDARLDGLGAEIRRLRGERGLSAAALAREVGVSPSLISQIDRSALGDRAGAQCIDGSVLSARNAQPGIRVRHVEKSDRREVERPQADRA